MSIYSRPELRYVTIQLRALGNDRRLYILLLLKEKPRTGSALAEVLGVSAMTVSKHVQRLVLTGFVKGRRKKHSVVFHLTEAAYDSTFLWKMIESGVVYTIAK